MGEYAKLGADEIKIGTCESMYYLRARDRYLVDKLPGSLDPVREYQALRFRFPFPSEDGIEPGGYESHEPQRGRFNWLGQSEFMAEVEHGSIQLSSPKGLLASVPCPVGGKVIEGLKVHKNGYPGDLALDSTAFREGGWVVVLRCVCGRMFYVPKEHAGDLVLSLEPRFCEETVRRVMNTYQAEAVTA